MDLPLHEDDLTEPGVLEAHMLHRNGANVPPVAVLCFFNELLEKLEGEGLLSVKYVLRSEIGRNPIYEFQTDDGAVSVVHPGVGAPLAAGFVEEVAALVAFVAGPEASYITGANLPVDGGTNA